MTANKKFSSRERKAKFDSHIIIKADGADRFTARCAYCESRGIVDVSSIANDSPIYNSEVWRINREHKSCGEKWAAKQDADLMQTAAQHARSYVVMFAGEEQGARLLKAIEKAQTEIEQNKTIKFENGILTLVSRISGKKYIVTADNCSTNCPAAESLSVCYHRAVYQILYNFNALKNSNVSYPKFGRADVRVDRLAA